MRGKDWLLKMVRNPGWATAAEIYEVAANLWQDEEVRMEYTNYCRKLGRWREAQILAETTLRFYHPKLRERRLLSELLGISWRR